MILYGCVISTLLLCGGNADSIRLPVSGELVYDSTSKMARVCLFPKMCPPCVLERVCHLGNHPSPSPHSTESSTTSTPSTTSSSTEATSTSSGSPMTTEEALTSSTSSTPTPSSGTSTSPSTESTTGTSETTETWSSTNPTSSATTVTSTVGGGEGEEFQQAGLRAHNDFRKTHKSPPLSLSSGLNSDAQATADRIARQGKLQHTSQSELDDQGENLGKMCTYGETAEEIVPRVVTYWYYEVCDYNFNKPGWSSSTGHFTQLVWASTEELGLGVTAKDEDGATCYYVVGRYYPSGNVDNEYEENVKKGNFDPSLCSTKKRNLHRTNQVMDFIKRKWQHFVHKISE